MSEGESVKGGGVRSPRNPIIGSSLLILLVACSFVLLFIAYNFGPSAILDVYETLASLLFWGSILGFLLAVPLRNVLSLFASYMMRIQGTIWFVIYLSVHLFVYGLLLEGILIFLYKIPPIISQASVNTSSILAYPQSAITMLEDFAFNPSLNIVIPPGLSLSLSLYSFVVALVIAVLVVANVGKVMEVSKICTLRKKSLTYMVLPAAGVIGGAACCISLPFLIYLIAPASAYFTNSFDAYYIAYLAFPAATAIALRLNLDSTMKITSKL
jgi:hypothetical protein